MKPQRNRTRDVGFYVLIMVILLAVIYTMLMPSQQTEQLKYSDIVDMIRSEEVRELRIEGSTLYIRTRDMTEEDPAITYELYDVGLFVNHLLPLVDEQHEAGIIEDYDFDEGFVAPWWLSMVPYLLAGVIYWVFNFIVEMILTRIEKKMSYYHD